MEVYGLKKSQVVSRISEPSTVGNVGRYPFWGGQLGFWLDFRGVPS